MTIQFLAMLFITASVFFFAGFKFGIFWNKSDRQFIEDHRHIDKFLQKHLINVNSISDDDVMDLYNDAIKRKDYRVASWLKNVFLKRRNMKISNDLT